MTTASIQSLPSSGTEAARLGACLGIPIYPIAIHKFPDGELRVTVALPSPLTIVYGSLDWPNEKLLALLFAAEFLRRNGAQRLVLVAPYLCYMRQDTAFHAGEAISQKVVGRLLAEAFDRVVTVNAHLHRTGSIRDVFPAIDADNLSAMPAIATTLRTTGLDPATVIIGPDAESRPWVSELAERLGVMGAVAQKRRLGDRSVGSRFGRTQSRGKTAGSADRRYRFVWRHTGRLRPQRHCSRAPRQWTQSSYTRCFLRICLSSSPVREFDRCARQPAYPIPRMRFH